MTDDAMTVAGRLQLPSLIAICVSLACLWHYIIGLRDLQRFVLSIWHTMHVPYGPGNSPGSAN